MAFTNKSYSLALAIHEENKLLSTLDMGNYSKKTVEFWYKLDFTMRKDLLSTKRAELSSLDWEQVIPIHLVPFWITSQQPLNSFQKKLCGRLGRPTNARKSNYQISPSFRNELALPKLTEYKLQATKCQCIIGIT